MRILQESHSDEEIEKLFFFEGFLRNVEEPATMKELGASQSDMSSLRAAQHMPAATPPLIK